MDEENKDNRQGGSIKKGTNQHSVRGHNERLVLQLVRESGGLTKAEATRATGLSANACSMIFRALEDDGLLVRGEPIRGRVGQPSVPLRINPDARHYVALKIGRRSLELAVVNFDGVILSLSSEALPYPTPDAMLAFVQKTLPSVLRRAKKSRRDITAMAVAMPYELWSWTVEFGAPSEQMDAWKTFNTVAELTKIVPWNVIIENDATAACRAEVVFGSHRTMQDWIYFFVGTFIGGGVVLNGNVFPGRRGNAGGFGPMRVSDQVGGNRLVDHASLVVLERQVSQIGGNPFSLYDESFEWAEIEPVLDKWINGAARNLADAIVSSLAVMDFEGVVIDGAMPTEVKQRLVVGVKESLETTDLQGVLMPNVESGQIGLKARTIGAAAALISAEYLIDPNAPLQN